MDTVLKGNYSLRALSSPLVYDLIYDVTKSIKMNANESIYDRWLKNDPDSYKNRPLLIFFFLFYLFSYKIFSLLNILV